MTNNPASHLERTIQSMDSHNPLVRAMRSTWAVYLAALTEQAKREARNPNPLRATIFQLNLDPTMLRDR